MPTNLQKYSEALYLYTEELKRYFNNINEQDIKNKYTINNDIDMFKKYIEKNEKNEISSITRNREDMTSTILSTNISGEQNENSKSTKKIINNNFAKFYKRIIKDKLQTSELFSIMYELSPKFLACIFNIILSPGPVLVYSNYVRMEGLEVFKIYLSMFKYSSYFNNPNVNISNEYLRYGEFHGGIVDKSIKSETLKIFNNIENKHGKIMKIIMISPSGTEGLNLSNVRQVHILEPYWNEVRIIQIIGRSIRRCSHKNLPMDERFVEVFRYKVYKNRERTNEINLELKKKKKNITYITSDTYIENMAKEKSNLNNAFLLLLKQAAVDCMLFKNQNMSTKSQEYKCFQFTERSLFNKNIGPAYKDYIKDDMKINDGLDSLNSYVETVKVRKINAIIKLNNDKYTEKDIYWYYESNNTVYDFDLYYPIGQLVIDNNIPVKFDKDTYIITDMINIP